MTKHLSVAIALVLAAIYAFAQGGNDYKDYIKSIESTWDDYSQAKEFEKYQREQDSAFQTFRRQQEEEYRKYVEEVEKKWNEFIGSTEHRWVDYSEDKSVRSTVNFGEEKIPEEKPEVKPEAVEVVPGAVDKAKELIASQVEKIFSAPEEKPEETKGEITVEAVVPADTPDAVGKAKELIASQVEKIFSETNDARENILEGQVKTKAGEPVTPGNVKDFVRKEVLPEAKVAPKPVKSKDGVERVKVSVTIPLVPEHLKVRAEQYLSSVKKYCNQYKEDLPLVMAIIQTESYFNPLAKSKVPAYGLMQLVPEYSGRDANKYIYKKDEAPTSGYLFVPENNLMLGTAYMRTLRDNYFYGIEDSQKQEYLIIASYRDGAGRVIKLVMKKYNIQEMSPAELYEALKKELPSETKDYLAKVTSRKSNYLAWK